MVGIGGRSKACATCRRRRVKCDETRPKCQRCAKGNFQCGGYSEMRFIHFGKSSNHSTDPDASSPASNYDSDQALAHFIGSTTSKEYPVHALSFCLCPVPDLSGFQEEICVKYTLKYLLGGATYDGKTPSQSQDWSDEPLSNKCFLSLAITYFGSQHKENKLLKKGFKMYGVALRELNKALADPHQCQTRNVLDSITTMALFEWLISEDPTGWIAHSIGLERLFKLRGPASFQVDPDRLVLEKSRHTIIFGALALRRGTILSSPEWKTIPWALQPETKSSTEFLVDIFAECPEVSMLKDEIDSSNSVLLDPSSIRNVIERVSATLDKLEAWKTQWGTEIERATYEVDASLTSPLFQNSEGESVPVWSTILHYKTLSAANQTVLYNAILILLLRIVNDLLPFADDQSFRGGPIHPRMYAAGIDICRSVDFHLLCFQSGAGSYNIIFPLREAWQAVGHGNSSVGRWIEHVLHMIAYGTSIGRYAFGGKWAVAGYILKDFANIKGSEGT